MNLETAKAANALYHALQAEFDNVLDDGGDGAVMDWLQDNGHGWRIETLNGLPDEEYSECLRDNFCHAFEEYVIGIVGDLRKNGEEIAFPVNLNNWNKREYAWRMR